MAAPIDAYPLSTRDNVQIRLDIVKVSSLNFIDFTNTAGSTPVSTYLNLDGVYSLVADADCIVQFIGTATSTPANAVAVYLMAGERAFIQVPPTATGFSVIGISAAGRLYIQDLTPWAGLGNPVHLGSQ